MASNNESTPLLSHKDSLASKNSDLESLHALVLNVHGSDSNLPLRGQSGLSSPSALGADSLLYPYVPILCGLLCLVGDLGGGLTTTPEVRLLEVAVCRDYYTLHDPSKIGPPPLSYVDERYCKLDDIQADLAYLRAWKGTFMMIPGKTIHPCFEGLKSFNISQTEITKLCRSPSGLLLTVPFGRLADRWGRRPVLVLGLLGPVLAYFWVLLVCGYFEKYRDTRETHTLLM